MPSTQKIQIGLIVSLVGLVLTLAGHLVAYSRTDQTYRVRVDLHEKAIEKVIPKVESIDVIKNDIGYMKNDLAEIKLMIKEMGK